MGKEKLEQKIKGPYDLIDGKSYRNALANLQKNPGRNPIDGKIYVRPLSALETALARIEQPELFDEHLNTCTGIVYSGDGRLKIVPISEDLIKLPENFDDFLSLDYDEVNGVEIDYKNSKHKYDEKLTMSEALEHEFYKALIPDDKIRQKYVEKTFQKIKEIHYDEGMPIGISPISARGITWPLILGGLNANYVTDCYASLNQYGHFIRLTPVNTKKNSQH